MTDLSSLISRVEEGEGFGDGIRETPQEPFAYVASWTRKRSTARLRVALDAAVRVECECDSYVGFECSKHRRIEEARWALENRKAGLADAHKKDRP